MATLIGTGRGGDDIEILSYPSSSNIVIRQGDKSILLSLEAARTLSMVLLGASESSKEIEKEPEEDNSLFPALPFNIKLKRQLGRHLPGSIVKVVHVVPHGGYTDSPYQYVLADGFYVPSNHAEVLK